MGNKNLYIPETIKAQLEVCELRTNIKTNPCRNCIYYRGCVGASGTLFKQIKYYESFLNKWKQGYTTPYTHSLYTIINNLQEALYGPRSCD